MEGEGESKKVVKGENEGEKKPYRKRKKVKGSVEGEREGEEGCGGRE